MNQYTIKETAEILGLSVSTLRYYDKEGLLPFVHRSESGYRIFNDGDIGLLRMIECLKRTNMPIKEIRQFTNWLVEGDSTLTERYEMFLERKRAVNEQIAKLQKALEVIDHKCKYYKAAIEAGTEAVHFRNEDNSNTDDSLPCETFDGEN